MTTPKQITTQKAAEFASDTLDSPLGEKIGCTYRGSDPKFYNAELNIIKYTTDGKLLADFNNDMSIKDISITLDLGESAVKMRLKRAKGKVIKAYNEL